MALVSVTLNRKGYGMKGTLNSYAVYPASNVSKHLHKPRTFAREASREQDLNPMTVNAFPFVQPITPNSIELGSNPSIRTWITYTSWLTISGNTVDGGENAF